EVVLGEPGDRVAELVGPLRLLGDFTEHLRRRLVALARPHQVEDAEFHVSLLGRASYRAASTRWRKSSAPRRRSPRAEMVTRLAPSLMNSAMPAASVGELPPTPTSLPPALMRGTTWRMSCRTAAAPGFPMLWPRSPDATCNTSTPGTPTIASRLSTARV